MKKFIPADFEQKWIQRWGEEKMYDFDVSTVSKNGTFYTLVELPYPSGDLHIGHWFTFATPDVLSRFKRMSGYNVFFPHGYDAFGLPAENAAMKRGVHPKDWTMKNIESMTAQFQTMGSMIDWRRITVTCLPEYYRFNQWIFIKLFEHGLAYRGKTMSNWCETDQTVLANENVENGNCWRCGNPVVQKEVSQWFLKITDYADRLLWPQHPSVDWPESVRVGQNNWIGKSEGMLLKFQISNFKFQNKSTSFIEVYTTRPETIDGATFLVMAPEHPMVDTLTTPEMYEEVQDYKTVVQSKSEMERKENKNKTGVFTGGYVVNPVTKKQIPVWISDYVLSGYGTGAIMAVPAEDERDREFAKKFKLPIEPTSCTAQPDGEKKVHYHIHDWSISRQRYWGTPVPIVYCHHCVKGRESIDDSRKSLLRTNASEGQAKVESQKSNINTNASTEELTQDQRLKTIDSQQYVIIDGVEYIMHPVPLDQLPVTLPYDVDFTPHGKPPLASNESWMQTTCPTCGGAAIRDAETLDTFFDSSWYFLRYVNSDYTEGPFDKDLVKKLLPVDVYFGGAEHTLGHTLYARFFTKFFNDLGLVDFDEFAKKRIQHGIVLGPDGNKMSKSKGNVINPDDVVAEYGADTTRLYLCFMMPYDGTGAWSTKTIAGMHRFLKRVWLLSQNIDTNEKPSPADLSIMHKSIKKVGSDLEQIKCNTALAALMEWLNALSRRAAISAREYEVFLTLLAPFAPFMTEELWREVLGKKSSIHLEEWPRYDEALMKDALVRIAVQVNGKLRGLIEVATDCDQEGVVQAALADSKVKKFVGDSSFDAIYVPGKIVNIVLR